jgi:hypothetical protein
VNVARLKDNKSREYKNVVMIFVEILYYIALVGSLVPLAIRFSSPAVSADTSGFMSDIWSLKPRPEFWSWSQQTLLPFIYDVILPMSDLVSPSRSATESFTSNAFPRESSAKVLGGSGLLRIGPVRLRQFRVNQGTCRDDSAFRASSAFCSPDYSFDENDNRASFGSSDTPTYISGAFSYAQADDVRNVAISDFTRLSYPSGGFVIDLPDSKDQASHVLADLEASGWIDHLTAAVVVETVLYRDKFFVSHQMLFEYPQTGTLHVSQKTETFPSFAVSFVSASTTDMFLNVMTILLQVVGIGSIIFSLIKTKKRFFTFSWNYFDLVMLGIGFAYMGERISMMKLTQSNSLGDPSVFVPLSSIIPLKNSALQLQTALICLLFIRSLKFSLVFETKLIRSLHSSFATYLGVVVIAGFVLIGFSFAYYLSIGFEDTHYSAINESFTATCLSLLNVVWVSGYDGISPFISLWFIWVVCLLIIPLLIAISLEAWVNDIPRAARRHPFSALFWIWWYKIRRKAVVEEIGPNEIDFTKLPEIVKRRIYERRIAVRKRVEARFGFFPAEYDEFKETIDVTEMQRLLDDDSFAAKVLGSDKVDLVIENLNQNHGINSFQKTIDRKMDVLQKENIDVHLRMNPAVQAVSVEIQAIIDQLRGTTQADVRATREWVISLSRTIEQLEQGNIAPYQRLK